MIEKVWACRNCLWAPKNRDEESRICPKCGHECTHEDFLTDEKDIRAWHEDLRRENGVRRFRRPPDENLQ